MARRKKPEVATTKITAIAATASQSTTWTTVTESHRKKAMMMRVST